MISGANRGRMLILGVLLATVPFAAAGGKKDNKAAVASKVTETPEKYNIKKVALLPLANTSGVEDARDVEAMVYMALIDQGYYRISSAEAFAANAANSGLEDEHTRLAENWENSAKVSKVYLPEVVSGAEYDAVIVPEVSQWSLYKVDYTLEGVSTTSIRIRLIMYAADGELLWAGAARKEEESDLYDPTLNVKFDSTGQPRYNLRNVPDPPDASDLARGLVGEILATLPNFDQDAAAEEVEGSN